VIVLDTNVLSELMRTVPSRSVASWVAAREAEIFTTSITEAEIFFGIELLPKGKRRQELLAAAHAIFDEDLADRVLGFDGEAARIFSKIAAHRRELGRPISYADAQIAAIAQLRLAKLATRNLSDFRDCGIEVLNPWSES
jgi:predicted nucleic acid-binding protein